MVILKKANERVKYLLQVGGGADAGAPDLRTELILSVERNVFMAKNVYFLET